MSCDFKGTFEIPTIARGTVGIDTKNKSHDDQMFSCYDKQLGRDLLRVRLFAHLLFSI